MKATSNFPIVSFFEFTWAFACGLEKYLESVLWRFVWVRFLGRTSDLQFGVYLLAGSLLTWSWNSVKSMTFSVQWEGMCKFRLCRNSETASAVV